MLSKQRSRYAAFTLIELLVVIAIIAILAIVVVLTLNPAQLLAQSRDANRVSDMATLSSAISLYQTDQSGASSYSMGTSSVVYVSFPDNGSSTCGDLGFSALPSGYQYGCATSVNLRIASSSGWIPVNFNAISSGSPFGSLPIDPTNSSSSHLYYTYATNGNQFEVTAAMESAKYQAGGSNDEISGDGGPLATVYEKGTQLGIEPLDYGDPTLVGYWPLNEGTSTVAYDGSGNNATGSWSGTPVGTNGGFYSPGKTQAWAGAFDGTSTYVNVPFYGGIGNYSAGLTYAAWIKANTLTGNQYIVSQFGSPYVDLARIGAQIRLETNFLGASNIYSAAIGANTWVYIVATYFHGTGSLYINGALSNSTTSVPAGSTTAVALKIGQASGGGFFNGLIGDVRVYNRALSAAQIQAMYNAGK